MKYFFEVFGPNNIAAKNWLSIFNHFFKGPCRKIRIVFNFHSRILQGSAKICYVLLCLADLADGNIFFLVDTDLVAILDLAFYLK